MLKTSSDLIQCGKPKGLRFVAKRMSEIWSEVFPRKAFIIAFLYCLIKKIKY